MFKHPRPILIVDDDVELVTLLVDYLQLEGFAPTAAHNGTEAGRVPKRPDSDVSGRYLYDFRQSGRAARYFGSLLS